MLKKGPELKLPDLDRLKVPDFLLDLYYDLKDRHLLPLVGLLLVAIVAVPIALSQSGGAAEVETEGAAEAVATPSAVSSKSGVLVAKSAPGLRDYKRRLRHLEAEDPFVQQYQGEEPEPSSAAPGETGEGSSAGGFTAPTTEPEGPTPSAPYEPGSEPDPNQLKYFSYAIDVRIVPGASQESGSSAEAQVRRNLPELTMLPSRETPAVIYMGSTKDGKKALMMVSSNVEAIFGDAKCVLGSDSCQLLAVEPGVPETFVYGGEGRAFKIELLKVHLVETDKLNRAPLGKPKQGKSKQSG